MAGTNPAEYYRILIEGAIDPAWSDCLAGLAIEVEVRPGERAVSVLSGALRDQSALHGVLDTLFMLNLPVLLVERCPRRAC